VFCSSLCMPYLYIMDLVGSFHMWTLLYMHALYIWLHIVFCMLYVWLCLSNQFWLKERVISMFLFFICIWLMIWIMIYDCDMADHYCVEHILDYDLDDDAWFSCLCMLNLIMSRIWQGTQLLLIKILDHKWSWRSCTH